MRYERAELMFLASYPNFRPAREKFRRYCARQRSRDPVVHGMWRLDAEGLDGGGAADGASDRRRIRSVIRSGKENLTCFGSAL